MKNRMMATIASANRIGWMIAPPAMAMMSRMIPRIRSMPRRYPRTNGRTPEMPRPLTSLGTLSEVGAAERERREDRHARQVHQRVRGEQRTRAARAAERPELHDRPGDARHLLDEHAQRVAVEPLERQQPRRRVGDGLKRVRGERGADRPEEAGKEARAEDHQYGDPVRVRRQEDRAEQRERGDDHHRGGEPNASADRLRRPPVAARARP